jgi:hypothetical protein
MQVAVKLEGLEYALGKLDGFDTTMSDRIRRALFRIGGLWKKTAVDYAPISPSSSMLKAFQRKLKRGGADADTLYVQGRKGTSGRVVKITTFYQDRLSMLLSKDPRSTQRPMPGGLMRSITFRSDDSKVECFVPSNSPGGSYAAKMHDEKGRTWKKRGPGTQAKGPKADHKFISRAATDRERDFIAIVNSEIEKVLRR